AVPAAPRRPGVSGGGPWGAAVAADHAAPLLKALPDELRGRVRLAPGGRRDLLPLARSLASALDAEIEVTTGLPLFAAEGPLGEHGVRSVLAGPDGTPRWVPFVDAVLCVPARDAEHPAPPRLLRWFPPLRDFHDAAAGEVALSEEWRAGVTRAGLWVGPNDDGPVPLAARAVSGEGPVVEVGRPGERLTPSLWPLLARVLTGLSADLRSRATLQVHATPPDGGRALRALAAEQGLSVIRFASAPARGSRPAAPGLRRPPTPALRTGTEPAASRPSPPTTTTPAATPTPERVTATPVPAAAAASAPAPRPRTSLVSGTASTAAVVPDVPNASDTTSETPEAEPTQVPPRPLPTVPVSPRHRSTALERTSFLKLADGVWGRHSEAVNRVLAGMPALRGGEQEAARADLIAVRVYVRGGGDEGGLGHEELARSLHAGEERLVPYAACLASGLARLPSYRGAVLRGVAADAGHERPSRGQLLRDPAPLSGVSLDPGGRETIPGVAYAIWSITGRRVRQVQEDEGNEVVFPPGTAFRVLDVRDGEGGPLVLLRQLPDAGTAVTVFGDADDTALARLDHSLAHRLAPGRGSWPDRCAGPVGHD
ncbi:hypothetical protein ACWD25_36815, partial [Streptomyces sp. NPDC002920]